MNTNVTDMERVYQTATYALDTATGTTATILYQHHAGGSIIIPTGSSITSLTFYGATGPEGTFVAIYDGAATPAAVTLTVSAAKAYPIPDACFGYGALKIVVNAAGSVDICMKG